MCASIYYPFEDVAMRPTFGPMLPGTPHPTLTGNPHLRSGPFVGLPGYGMEAAEAGTNLCTDPQFSDVANWPSLGAPTTKEAGPQFAMDSGEFFRGMHIVTSAGDQGVRSGSFFTISPSTVYTLSCWVYLFSGDFIMSLLEYDAGDALLQERNTSPITSPVRTWFRLDHTFSATHASAAKGKIDIQSLGLASKWYAWLPQLEQSSYATPARVGTQPASYLYVPSPISETQTPWSVLCVVTPDWDYSVSGMPTLEVWSLHKASSDRIRFYYYTTSNLWRLLSRVASVNTYLDGAASTHSRLDKIHLAVTCDGYNAYLYVNGTQYGPIAMGSVQPVNLLIGAQSGGVKPFNGVIDDFAFIEGAAIPEFRCQELYRAFLRGVPLHGIQEVLG